MCGVVFVVICWELVVLVLLSGVVCWCVCTLCGVVACCLCDVGCWCLRFVVGGGFARFVCFWVAMLVIVVAAYCYW